MAKEKNKDKENKTRNRDILYCSLTREGHYSHALTLPKIQTKYRRKIDAGGKILRQEDIVINKEERERRVQKEMIKRQYCKYCLYKIMRT